MYLYINCVRITVENLAARLAPGHSVNEGGGCNMESLVLFLVVPREKKKRKKFMENQQLEAPLIGPSE